MALGPSVANPKITNRFGTISNNNVDGWLFSDAHGPRTAYFKFARPTEPKGYVAAKCHQGTDYAASIGIPVLAREDGVVVGHGYSTARGKYVILRWPRKGGGWVVNVTQHLSKVLVPDGTVVKKGQHIALTGNTGYLPNGNHPLPHDHNETRYTTSVSALWKYWQRWAAINGERCGVGGDLAGVIEHA